MQTIDEYIKKIQNAISNSKIVASTNIEYIKVLENEGCTRGTLTLIDGSELRSLKTEIAKLLRNKAKAANMSINEYLKSLILTKEACHAGYPGSNPGGRIANE